MTINSLESYDIYEAIDQLRLAAIELGDESMASKAALALGNELYDSDTGTIVPIASAPKVGQDFDFQKGQYSWAEAQDLEATANYVEAISLSLNEGTAEGHIRVGGRRVYAA